MSSIEVENLQMVEWKTADDRGRVSLGKRFADARVKVIVDDPNHEVDNSNK